MNEELALVNQLMSFTKQKQTLLTTADSKSLNEVLGEEEEITCALREKEEERKAIAETLACELGVSGKELPLKKLLEHIDDPACRQRLSSAKTEMAKAIRQLSYHNVKVKELLKHQIGYADFMINLLHLPQSKNQFYNVMGNMEDAISHSNLLDYHV